MQGVLDRRPLCGYVFLSVRSGLGRRLTSLSFSNLPILPAGEFSVPNIKSAKKDLRKSRAAAVRNRAQRSALRTAVKRAKLAAAAADDRLSAVSLLDRAARKGLIHRNAAARQKSKLAKAANAAAA